MRPTGPKVSFRFKSLPSSTRTGLVKGLEALPQGIASIGDLTVACVDVDEIEAVRRQMANSGILAGSA